MPARSSNSNSDKPLQLVARKQPKPTSSPLASNALDDFLAHGGELEFLRAAYGCRWRRALNLVLVSMAREIRRRPMGRATEACQGAERRAA